MAVDPVLLVGAGVVGLCFGSFLNVCILRLPNEERKDRSLFYPASTCPSCKKPIAWFDNIPVFSWLWLRGKCRNCRAPISAQYPIIELIVGLLWGAALLGYGLSARAASAAVFGTILLGIGVIDARHKIIPDEMSLGGLVVGIGLSLVGGFNALVWALVGAAVGWSVLWVVRVVGGWVFKQEAMGGGDVKMLALIGAFVGWRNALLTIFVAAALGTAFYAPLIALKYRQWRRYELPFGVFLAAAAAVTFVAGDAMVSWYVDFLRAR